MHSSSTEHTVVSADDDLSSNELSLVWTMQVSVADEYARR